MYIKITLAVVTVQNLVENAVTSARVSCSKKKNKYRDRGGTATSRRRKYPRLYGRQSRLLNSVPELSRHRLQHSSEGY